MEYRSAAEAHLHSAAQAFYQGDHSSAFRHTRAALLTDPNSVEAWLWLSKLVDDPERQRECFERVLMLDPHNGMAQDGIERLRLAQLLASVQAPALHQRTGDTRQLGVRLVEQQLISNEQLQVALRQQRSQKIRGEFAPLGDILIKNGWVTPRALANALIEQLNEKRTGQYGQAAPQFLGEYLVIQGLISTTQLEAALEEQMRLRAIGQKVTLGSLLLRQGCIDPARLQRVLDQQRVEFYSRMGD